MTDKLLSEREASVRLGLHKYALAGLRRAGNGPAFTAGLQRSAWYAPEALSAWAAGPVGRAVLSGVGDRANAAAPAGGPQPVRYLHPDTPPGRRPRTCQWPIGDPLEAGFRMCGEPVDAGPDGWPYCAAHLARARRRRENPEADG